MNTQQVTIAFFIALERAEVKNKIEKTRSAVRAAGLKASNTQISAWIGSFLRGRNKNGTPADEKRTGKPANLKNRGRENKHGTDEKRTGVRTENGLTRNKEPIVRSETPNGVTPSAKAKRPKEYTGDVELPAKTTLGLCLAILKQNGVEFALGENIWRRNNTLPARRLCKTHEPEAIAARLRLAWTGRNRQFFGDVSLWKLISSWDRIRIASTDGGGSDSALLADQRQRDREELRQKFAADEAEVVGYNLRAK